MFGMQKTEETRRVVVVRADRVADGVLMEALRIGRDHHALVAVREIGRRLEEELLDEAFAGTPEQRLRNLARLEGVRELVAQVEVWREKAEKVKK